MGCWAMDTLQARFRDQATEILQNNATVTVAMGRGQMCNIETCYVVGHSDELYCLVKANPALVEAVQDDARIAFAVTKGFPNRMLQGTGRAFFLGRLDQHPQIREQILTKSPDAAPFMTTIRNLGVLQILPDQIAITDDTNLGLGPRPIYLPEAARALPDWWNRWLQAIGIPSWPLVLIPVLVAALLAREAAMEVTWWLLVPFASAVVLIYVGTILLATYVGCRRHMGRSQALGSGRLLYEGLLPARDVWLVGMLCLTGGLALGLFLVGLRGTPLLVMGLSGVAGGLLYAGWPVYLASRVFEEAVVFICLGPLVVLAAYDVLTGVSQARPFLVSLPVGCLMASILHASHLHTFSEDIRDKRHTLAVLLGWEKARLLFDLLVGLPFLLALILILTGTLPGWAWLILLSLPLAVRSVASVWQASAAQTQVLAGLDRHMAQTYLAFGVLLVLGLIFA
jgi:1,4-dihydroxy-2-naphthoate octaprenyltransferase